MGSRGRVGINQPALNGMAKNSERQIWSKGHALCCGVKLSSYLVLPFHSSVHPRPASTSLVALPARWAGVSRSRVSLQRGWRLKSPAWSTPIIFHLCQERQKGFPSSDQGKEQGKLVWGSTRSWLSHDSHPAPATPQLVMVIQRSWCECKSWTALLGQRAKKELNYYRETIPCLFLISLHWNVAADMLFW